MKLQTLAAACAALAALSVAAPSFAGAVDENPVVAKLSAPVAKSTKFIAGGAVFKCEGDECVAVAPQSQTFTAQACKTIAKTVGSVASFGDGRNAYDAAKLGACNGVNDTQVAKR